MSYIQSTTQECWLYFISYTSSDVKVTEETGFRVRHTFIACWFINSLAERQLSFCFLNWWGLIMLLGWIKLLIPASASQVTGTIVMCHYTQAYGNFHAN